ncbi:hypothetical protein [Paenibacillus elgii]|uniref:hypothetical protein n=1 Tax=Paenibacillus elgii TaxID=189691 RepID=UPI000248C309|nr:hypothetical protein [Paenibacillus elgii]
MQGFIAKDPFSGTANMDKKLSDVMTHLVISNDGSADLTFTAGNFTLTLPAGEIFDERIDPFMSLNVIATGKYHGYCRARA